jgi:hypothetical protein
MQWQVVDSSRRACRVGDGGFISNIRSNKIIILTESETHLAGPHRNQLLPGLYSRSVPSESGFVFLDKDIKLWT